MADSEGEQRLRPSRIVGIRFLQRVHRPRIVGVGEPGSGHAAEVAHHPLHDGVLVDGQVQGQADLARALEVGLRPRHRAVVARLGGPLAAEDDVDPGDVGHGERAHADLLQFVDVLAADFDDVDAAGSQHGHARGRLGHLQHHQTLEVGRRAPVPFHRLVDDTVAADVLDELPRPGPDRAPLRAFLAGALDRALGLDEGHGSEEALVDLVGEDDRRLVEVDRDGVATLDIHALD